MRICRPLWPAETEMTSKSRADSSIDPTRAKFVAGSTLEGVTLPAPGRPDQDWAGGTIDDEPAPAFFAWLATSGTKSTHPDAAGWAADGPPLPPPAM